MAALEGGLLYPLVLRPIGATRKGKLPTGYLKESTI